MNPVTTFINLAEKTLVHVKIAELVSPVTEEEEIAFHRMHERLLCQEVPEQIKSRMSEWYPFVKVDRQWKFSAPKFYMYLFYSRPALLATKNGRMLKLHDAVVKATAYTDKVKEIGDRLRPKSFENWDDYQKQLSAIYEQHLVEQMDLFKQVKKGLR